MIGTEVLVFLSCLAAKVLMRVQKRFCLFKFNYVVDV